MLIERARKVYRGKLWMLPVWLAQEKAHRGHCPICEKNTIYVKYHPWLRDNYRCIRCWSIPRQRAIIRLLSELVADWSVLRIHESSPEGVASRYIAQRAGEYVATHYYPDVCPGDFRDGFRCENLEQMTFPDNSFDLIVTQDVMEHVLDPESAFREIARTLKPGGMHVFTVPVYSHSQTLIRARHAPSGGIEYIEKPDYHGNPIDAKGALVAREWGRDIIDFIARCSELATDVRSFDNKELGLVAEFLDVLVTRKPKLQNYNAAS